MDFAVVDAVIKFVQIVGNAKAATKDGSVWQNTANSNMEVAMLVSPTPTEVRWIVDESFRKYFQISDEELEDLVEIPMIDGGRCIARSYRVSNLLAMWLMDVGILQFYDEQGRMLRRANLFAEIEPPPAMSAAAA